MSNALEEARVPGEEANSPQKGTDPAIEPRTCCEVVDSNQFLNCDMEEYILLCFTGLGLPFLYMRVEFSI